MELATCRPLVSISLVLAATAAHVASSVDEGSLWVSLAPEDPGSLCWLGKGSLEVAVSVRMGALAAPGPASGWGAAMLLLADAAVLEEESFSSERRLK